MLYDLDKQVKNIPFAPEVAVDSRFRESDLLGNPSYCYIFAPAFYYELSGGIYYLFSSR